MPYCPKCKYEFQDWCTVCNDCGEPLVDKLPEENQNPESYGKEAYLMSVASSIEAEFIISQLESHKIPVLKKYTGSSAYINIYMGATNLGVDLYVPESALEASREILSAKPEPVDESESFGLEQQEEEEETPFDYQEFRNKSMRIFAFVIMLPVFILILILIRILRIIGIIN